MVYVLSKPPSIREPDIRQKIHQSLDEYLSYRRPSGCAVSVKEAIAIIRDRVFGCDFSDNVLTDIIAAHAIQRNYNLYFDIISGTIPYTLILEESH